MTLIVDITTSSATAIKTLIDSLKEILLRCNIRVSDTGIDMVAYDPTKSAIIQMNLNADTFDKFEVIRPVNIGLNVIKLNKILRTVASSDILNLSISEDDPNTLCITIKRKKLTTIYRVATTDDNANSNIIDVTLYDTNITMPSGDFQKIIRDVHTMTDVIEITVVGTENISFCGTGDMVSRETIIETDNNPDVNITGNPDEMILGVFDLSFLSSFARCTSLDTNVEIFMKKEMPIVLQYRCAGLGTVKFMLSDIVKRNNHFDTGV